MKLAACEDSRFFLKIIKVCRRYAVGFKYPTKVFKVLKFYFVFSAKMVIFVLL